jgi:hypothetical protein
MSNPVRGTLTWQADIRNSSLSTAVYIDHLEIYWWGGDMLQKAAFKEKLIFLDDFGRYSPQVLTFDDLYDKSVLLVPANSSLPHKLQFTFLSNYFTVAHVKVFFSNGCYVQYWSP